MPVSTTLLLLTSFASEMSAVSRSYREGESKWLWTGFFVLGILYCGLRCKMVAVKWLEKPMNPAWVGFQWITTVACCGPYGFSKMQPT